MSGVQRVPEGSDPQRSVDNPSWVHNYVDPSRAKFYPREVFDPHFDEDGFMMAEPLDAWQNLWNLLRRFDWRSAAAVATVYVLTLVFWRVMSS